MTDPTAAALVQAAVPLFLALRTRQAEGGKHLQGCSVGMWLGGPGPQPCGGRCRKIADWLAAAEALEPAIVAAPAPRQPELWQEKD